jgi:hypothetical protein
MFTLILSEYYDSFHPQKTKKGGRKNDPLTRDIDEIKQKNSGLKELLRIWGVYENFI